MSNFIRNSTGDKRAIRLKYLHDPESYRKTAEERLQSALLGPEYRKLLEKQIQDCYKEEARKKKDNSIIWK